MKSKTYDFAVICYNCKAKTTLHIPNGTTVSDYLVGHICKNCGCFTVGKVITIGAGDKELWRALNDQR